MDSLSGRLRVRSSCLRLVPFLQACPPRNFDWQCATRRGLSAQLRCCLVVGWRFSRPTQPCCTPVRSTTWRCPRRMRRITARCRNPRITAARALVLAAPRSARDSRHRRRSHRRALSRSSNPSLQSTSAPIPPMSSSRFHHPSDRPSSSVDALAAAPLGRRGSLTR